ncbi:MAG: hypothetical protein COV44_08710 [Deltaproteobacteria bacterium CG11_big_fil_rev_8_21_14_0_20_45_16]|nr:MAG: hypothetical protein COV44_08710 [Deltaproteobacteria bacterium CG11_big_fil_rev_8_21_14_0_20_45_16]
MIISKIISFETFDRESKPIYHTNVMMSLGEHLAIVCLEAITDKASRERVKKELQRRDYRWGQSTLYAGRGFSALESLKVAYTTEPGP